MELNSRAESGSPAAELASAPSSSSSISSSSHSSSLSSIDFKLSNPPSIDSSLPRGSSADSSILWLYTSCAFKNFPYKSLSSSSFAAKSGITTLCLAESPNLVLVGTECHGFSSARDSEGMGTSGGSVKAILTHQNHVLTAHQDGKIRVWNTKKIKQKKNKVHHSHEEHEEELQMELHQTLPTITDVLSRSVLPSNYIQVRRHNKKLWVQHADAVSCLAATKDHIFSASWDRSIKVWRTTDWKCLESMQSAHDDAINAIVASPQFVYTAAADGKIKAWEISSSLRCPSHFFGKKKKGRRGLSLVAVLERHKSSVNALAMDQASGYLYSASSDKSIVVWEREETAMHMAAVDALRGHCMAVLCLAVSSGVGDGHFFLCSGSADKTIRVWSRERSTLAHSCLCVIKGHLGPVKSVSMSACSSPFSLSRGARVVSGGLDCQVKTWWISLDGSSCLDQDEDQEKL